MAWEQIASVGSVLVAGAGAWFAHRRTTRQDSNSEIGQLWKRIDQIEARQRISNDYINALRNDLSDAGLDVRPWPAELIKAAST